MFSSSCVSLDFDYSLGARSLKRELNVELVDSSWFEPVDYFVEGTALLHSSKLLRLSLIFEGEEFLLNSYDS